MARRKGHKSHYNFVGGINTEATQLTSVENTAQSMSNFDISRGGKVSRRLGVDFEDSYAYAFNEKLATTSNDSLITNPAYNYYEWKAPAGNGNKTFLVIQTGTTLHFFDLSQSPISGSNGYLGSEDISSFKTTASVLDSTLSFTSGKGTLFASGEDFNPFYVEFNDVTNSFSSTVITLKVRDFEGVDDGLDADERPTTLSSLHKYNLRNQGWPEEEVPCSLGADGDGGATYADPINYTFTGISNTAIFTGSAFYPSNSDIYHLGKLSSAPDPENVGAYHPYALTKISMGLTEAPKGHYILNVFDKDRSNTSGIPGITKNSTVKRPTQVAFFGGRVFYAGVPESTRAGTIYFSQLLRDLSRAERCYQEQDPTAEELNDLLDTDGGTIEIPEIGNITKMVAFNEHLVVIATNGIWTIKGSPDTGFTPNNFSVEFVTTVGSSNPRTVLSINGGVSYWADEGIFVLSPSESGLSLTSKNITRDRIDTLYQGIDAQGRTQASSYFDREGNKIYWAYNSSPPSFGEDFPFQYDSILIYDITLDAFYEYDIASLTENGTISKGNGYPFISGIVRAPSVGVQDVTLDVVAPITADSFGEDIFLGLNTSEVVHDSLDSAWDITSTQTSESITDISGDIGSSGIRAIEFSQDGTVMWVSEDVDNLNIYQYTLSTAWDPSSKTLDYTLDTSTFVTSFVNERITAIFVKPDGTEFYWIHEGLGFTNSNEAINQITLDTANDLSDVSAGSHKSKAVEDIRTSERSYTGMALDYETGTTLILTNSAQDRLEEATLSTGWDISTCGSASGTVVTPDHAGDINGLYVKPTGKEMFTTDANDDIVKMNFTTKWDLSTYDSGSDDKVSFVSGADEIRCLHFKDFPLGEDDGGFFDVVQGANDVILSEEAIVATGSADIKLITMVPRVVSGSSVYSFTFSEFKDTSFYDWATAASTESHLTPNDGVAYESSLETWYEILEDGSRDKQIRFIMFHFEQTETSYSDGGGGTKVFTNPSSCLFTAKWGWSNDSSANRWTGEKEIYRLRPNLVPDTPGAFTYGFDVVSAKIRARGHGQAVSFKLRSSDNKDLRLFGWDVEYIARTRF